VYGPFEVIERLGIGGMATVHRAIERGIEGFERVVALKRLLPHLAEDEAFVRAFVREAKLASLLQHANIVQLYELGRVGTSYFISMEYIRGRDARRVLRQAKRVTGPLPVPIAVAIIGELLDALDYAHNRTDEEGNPLGLVHRDISPSNLLISHTGHLKVIDFGIAKATLGHLATHTGRIKGKLSYMAPEALTGKSSLDNRSDLFSASIIAHELLTAHPLFAARNDFHTIERVQSMQAPPPSERNPEVPPALDALVLRGLSKEPAQRWRNAGEMRAALADVTTRHRLTCTNREVADWVEIAFALGHSQELAPGSPMPTPPSYRALSIETSGGGTMPLGLVPRPEAADGDGDSDEILDLVWDSSGDGEGAPVLIDEVPDVSLRFTLADPVDDDDPTSMRDYTVPEPPRSPAVTPLPRLSARPSTDPFGEASGDARITFKPPSVPPPIASGELSAVREPTPRPSTVPIRGGTGRGKRLRPPSEWATGTSPANNRPSRRELGVQGTGPNEALLDAGSTDQDVPVAVRRPPSTVDIGGGIVSRELGPSRIWWVMGAVAVGAVIGLVAWAATGHESKPRAAAQPPPAAAARTPIAASASLPVVRAVPTAPPAMHISAAEPEVAAEKNDKKRKSHGAGESQVAHSVPAAVPPAATPAAVPAPMEPTLSRAPSLLDTELRPLPVPVQTPPASKPRALAKPAAAPASAEPVLVPPTRAHKRSGSLPILRGSKNAAPLHAITAKLCVDRRGSVTSVKILSKAESDVRDGLEQALSRWHYDPIVESGSAISACFATTFRVSQR